MGFPDTEEKLIKGLTRTVNPIRTLCEVLREIWDKSLDIKEEPIRQEIQERLKEAYMMGKRMDSKLHEYKHNWWNGIYDKNGNYDKSMAIRQGR